MKMKKTDWIILIAALIVCAGAFLIISLKRDDGAVAAVYVDGEQTAVYPLDTDLNVTIEGIGGTNVLEIKDHQAKIVSADCPDLSCTHQMAIRSGNESIVCLPHRVSVMILSEEESAVDAVAR